MTFSAQVNGVIVRTMDVTVPSAGAWSARVALSSITLLPTSTFATVIEFDGVRAVGTVTRQGVYGPEVRALITGGAGQWGAVARPRAYRVGSGVPCGPVIRDLATELGERIGILADARYTGDAYVRPAVTGAEILRMLPGDLRWWVDLDGRTSTGVERTRRKVTGQFQITGRDADDTLFTVVPTELAEWIPGASFTFEARDYVVSASRFRFDSDGSSTVDIMCFGA